MAVYTKLTFAEISDFLKNYNIGALIDFSEIVAGIDNSNFIINTAGGKFILTIFEERINKNELPFFVELKLHLAQHKICCPAPIIDNKGLTIGEIKNKKAIIVNFLNGKILQPLENGYYNNVLTQHCYEVGKLIAKLHLASTDFKMFRKNDLGIEGFLPLISKFENVIEPNLKDEILSTILFVKNQWKSNLPSGAAHLDIFIDNVFFDDKNCVSGIIDFYFSANDLFIYDFAIAVNPWCFDEKNIFSQEKFLALKKGYEEIRKFSQAELDFLPTALIAASTRFLLTRMHDKIFTPPNSLVIVKDPQEYLDKLRFFNGFTA